MAVKLTDDSNFESEIGSHEKVVVKYFADWCGTCKLFAPKFKRLSDEERFQGIVFLDVNAEKNPVARKMGGVKNLPTIAIFRSGELIETVCSGKEEVVTELIEKLNV